MRARIHRRARRRRRVIDALAIRLGMAAQLVGRRHSSRWLGMVAVAGMRHGQRVVDEVVVVEVVLPLVSPDVAGALAVELVSVDGVPGIVLVDVVVVVDALSLVVDVVVGVVEVVVVVEPGVALAPELLYEVLAPLLQPASAAEARARAAI